MKFNFQNSYTDLPSILFSKVIPTPVREPKILLFNQKLSDFLGLDTKYLASQPEFFSGNRIPNGSVTFAQAYAGHQFAHFNILGDGRAIMLGEHITPTQQRFDIQLKGSGQTPYSRNGDGRAALGPMLREYIISEFMYAVGVPSTRSLAVTTTGEAVYREAPLPGAILTRVAASHIRVGTFEFAAVQGGIKVVKALADYSIQRHYEDLFSSLNPYLSFFEAILDRQAALIAKWMSIGFIHGVMNTDNMAISGQTIDYGPCAFMDHYDPDAVFSSIDRMGRYAFNNQATMAQWNLTRLAETLLPLLDEEPQKALELAKSLLASFSKRFELYWLNEMRKKIGLQTQNSNDLHLINELLHIMSSESDDYTNTFRNLIMKCSHSAYSQWCTKWMIRLNSEGASAESAKCLMDQVNPIVIPRNHLVEKALQEAVENDDLSYLNRLLRVLENPFLEDSISLEFQLPPTEEQRILQTFCGT